jgi:hypothetical protein
MLTAAVLPSRYLFYHAAAIESPGAHQGWKLAADVADGDDDISTIHRVANSSITMASALGCYHASGTEFDIVWLYKLTNVWMDGCMDG